MEKVELKRISDFLSRTLHETELVTCHSLESIPGTVADVVVSIASRDLALAFTYLNERVPDAPRSSVEKKVQQLTERSRGRWLSFSDQEVIRAVVGRDLEPNELVTFESLEAVSDAVEAIVAKIFYGRGAVMAVAYLYERVPKADHGDVKIRTQEIETKYGRDWKLKR